MHEAIHAYFYVKKYNCEDGTNIDTLNNQQLGDLINEYYDGSCPTNQEQHNFMFDYLVLTMQTILNEIKNDLIPEVYQTSAEEHLISNTTLGISQLWNWQDCFKYLSLSELDMAESFITDITHNPSENFIFKDYKTFVEENLVKTAIKKLKDETNYNYFITNFFSTLLFTKPRIDKKTLILFMFVTTENRVKIKTLVI